MAYAFDSINQALKDQQKQNIFGAVTSGPQGSATSGPPGGQVQQQTTEGGAIQSGQSSGGTPGAPAPAPDAPSYSAASGAGAIKRNVGKVEAPKFTGALSETLKAQNEALTAEANAYQDKAAKTSYDVDAGVLDKALTGDQEAYSTLSNRLGEVAKPVEAFKSSQPLGVADVDNLGTEAGLSQLIQREVGPGKLTGAEAAFDARLLGGNADFQNIRRQLLGEQEGLRKRGGELEDTATKTAQETLAANLKKAQEGIRGGLSEREAKMMAEIEKQVAAENKKRADLRAGKGLESIKTDDEILAELQKQYADDKAGIGKHLSAEGLDLSKYLTVGKDLTARDLASAEQANQFNTIMQLLGKGGQAWTAGSGAGDAYSFDREGYEGALYGAADRRDQAANAAAQAKIDALLNQVSGRTSDMAAVRERDAQDTINKLKQQYGEAAVNDALGQVSVHDFANAGYDQRFGKMTGIDLATLNELSQSEFGHDYEGPRGGGGSSLDVGSYEQALSRAIQAKQEDDAMRARMAALGGGQEGDIWSRWAERPGEAADRLVKGMR